MKEYLLEEIIELVESCRHGVSLLKLIEENSKWEKKTLRKGLLELARQNKLVKLGKGKAVRYFAVPQDSSIHFPSVVFSINEEGSGHIMRPVPSEAKWLFLNKYIIRRDIGPIRKCARAIFSLAPPFFSRSLLRAENNDKFSIARRIIKEKTDMESHKVLNPKINLITLNI